MAALAACAPRSIADTSENAPVYRAMGVRAPATTTTSVGNILPSFVCGFVFGSRWLNVLSTISIPQRLRRYHCVSTTLARLIHGELRAVNQVGNDVLALIFLFGGGFHDSRAQRDLRGIPWRTNARGRTP